MNWRDFYKKNFLRKSYLLQTKSKASETNHKFLRQPFTFDYKIYYDTNSASPSNRLTVEILSGPLKDKQLEIEQEITDCKMNLFLKSKDETIARSLIDRNLHTSEIIYWDVMVNPKYRMKGLASFMTRYMLRELLLLQKKVKFMIRMIRIYQPTDTTIRLQNLGICIIAHRLGLTCEFDLPKLLNPQNIIKVEVIPPEMETVHTEVTLPPCYKIDLQSYPYVLIGFILDPKTKKPITNYDTYLQIKYSPEVMAQWIKSKAIVIGNGNYLLKKDGFDDFVKCLAEDSYEAEVFRKKLQSY
ncbi:MAG: hypothetical protein N2201_00195 [candidate division WOR-3 bacterium]|nr:hypothetical protein [candidate division WOR-3 bacterium]